MSRLKIVESMRVEPLLDALAAVLRAPTSDGTRPGPFDSELLALGSPGMRETVELGLTARLGICANVSFPFAAEAINRLVLATLREEETQRWTGEDPWQADPLTFFVLAELDQALGTAPADTTVLSDDLWAPLRNWEAAAQPKEGARHDLRDLRRWELAQNIAAVFDRYVYHRHEMTAAWRCGKAVDANGRPLHADLVWQQVLFQEVSRRVTNATGWPSGSERIESAIRALQNSQTDLSRLIALHRMTFFCVSSLPPPYLRLIQEVSRVLDVHIFLRTSSEEWLGEIRRGRATTDEVVAAHPLLQTFGRPAVAQQQLMLELDLPVGDLPLPPAPMPFTLLQAVQDGIRRNQPAAVDPVLATPDVLQEPRLTAAGHAAASIEVHACPGAVRQAEVLRDVLLRRLAADHTLEPRDILVVVPDVSTWYPLLVAVMGEGQAGPTVHNGEPLDPPDCWNRGAPRLPWRVADVAIRDINPLAQAMLQLFALGNDRRSLDALVDLLRAPALMQRFGLQDEDIHEMHAALLAAGARWGIDAHDRDAAQVAACREGTWLDAVDRLLLGMLSSDGDTTVDGLAPSDAAWSARRVLGPGLAAVLEIVRAIRALEGERTLAGWLELLEGDATGAQPGLLERLFDLSAQPAWFVQQVTSNLATLRRATGWLSTRVLPARVLARWFAEAFELRQVAAERFLGGITITSIRQARGVPARVTVLLGADEAQFPRRTAPAAWDLIGSAPRHTDVFPRDEDRASFLDLVLLARDALVVLYSGEDPTDGTELAPAVPVSDLISAAHDVLRRPCTSPQLRPQLEAYLGIRHALVRHAASSYQSDRPTTWSYDRPHLRRAQQVLQRRQSPPKNVQHGLFLNTDPSQPPLVQFSAVPTQRGGGSLAPAAATAGMRVGALAQLLGNPSRWQLRNQLGINLRTDEVPADGEVLPLTDGELGAFASRQLAKDLIAATQQFLVAQQDRPRLAEALAALYCELVDTASSGDLEDPKRAVLAAWWEHRAARDQLPALHAKALATMEAHLDAWAAALRALTAPSSHNARPPQPLTALRRAGLVLRSVPSNTPMAHQSTLVATLDWVDHDARRVSLLTPDSLHGSIWEAWAVLLLLETTQGGDEPWSVAFLGLTGPAGAVAAEHLSLGWIADVAVRKRWASCALQALACVPAVAGQRPLLLLRHASAGVCDAFFAHCLSADGRTVDAAAVQEAIEQLDAHELLGPTALLDPEGVSAATLQQLFAEDPQAKPKDLRQMLILAGWEEDLGRYEKEYGVALSGAFPLIPALGEASPEDDERYHAAVARLLLVDSLALRALLSASRLLSDSVVTRVAASVEKAETKKSGKNAQKDDDSDDDSEVGALDVSGVGAFKTALTKTTYGKVVAAAVFGDETKEEFNLRAKHTQHDDILNKSADRSTQEAP